MPGPRTQPRRKIVAIMAADVAGYSRLMGRDEVGTYSALRGHLDELFIPKIDEFEGRIIKFIGDGVLAEFPSAVDALNCAALLQAQMAMRNRDVPTDTQLNFRIGLHVGDVMEADGDLFGDGVNTAARVEGTATPGGINVSRFVYESVRKKVPLTFEDLGDHMFKSFEEPVQVYRVHGFQRPQTELRLGETRQRIAPGTRLNDIYEIDTLLAVGSTSEVYRAHAVQTDDPVVIKAFAPQLTQTAAAIDNVRSQASALYNLKHEAIARTFVCSVDETIGQVYLAMEAVDGISLGDRVRHTPLSPDEADILRQRIAGALAEAHAAGIIHRAVTPDNIVLPEGDAARCKLIDFTIIGLRPDSERTVLAPSLDAANLFQAPEQLGHFGGQEGTATDAYGLGQVIAFALTGSNLQGFATFAELVEGRREPPDVGPLPARIRPLVQAMLTPDPQKRLSDMVEIGSWDWTRPVRTTKLPDRQEPAAEPERSKPNPRSAERKSSARLIAIMAGLAGLAIAGGVAWYAMRGDDLASLYGGQATDPLGIGETTEAAPSSTSSGGSGVGNASAIPESDTGPSSGGAQEHTSQPPTSGQSAVGPQPPNEGEETASTEAASPTGDTTETAQPQSPPAEQAAKLASLHGRDNTPAEIAALMEQVDTLNEPECFFASVDKAADKTLFVDMYAQEADVIYDAYNSLKNAVGFDPNVTGRLISDPQCPALSFAALAHSTSQMGLTLTDRSLPAGTALDGTLSDVPAPHVLLVAIDPRGAVYDLSQSLEPGPNGLRFRLNVNHPARGSITNLLLAVSMPSSVEAPQIAAGTMATDFLPALAQALRTADQPVAVRLDHFVLRS